MEKTLEESWKNHEPAPIEFLHSKLFDLFHDFRKANGGKISVPMNGKDITMLLAKAKKETYAKYPNQVSKKPILKLDVEKIDMGIVALVNLEENVQCFLQRTTHTEKDLDCLKITFFMHNGYMVEITTHKYYQTSEDRDQEFQYFKTDRSWLQQFFNEMIADMQLKYM